MKIFSRLEGWRLRQTNWSFDENFIQAEKYFFANLKTLKSLHYSFFWSFLTFWEKICWSLTAHSTLVCSELFEILHSKQTISCITEEWKQFLFPFGKCFEPLVWFDSASQAEVFFHFQNNALTCCHHSLSQFVQKGNCFPNSKSFLNISTNKKTYFLYFLQIHKVFPEHFSNISFQNPSSLKYSPLDIGQHKCMHSLES